MNDKISWDASLIKKFGSSNHYKLLNQLRTEVKKYPLNKKTNILGNNSIDKNRSTQTTQLSNNLQSNGSEIQNKANIERSTNNTTIYKSNHNIHSSISNSSRDNSENTNKDKHTNSSINSNTNYNSSQKHNIYNNINSLDDVKDIPKTFSFNNIE
tara:strand:- start:7277 stop:7741 length:465 start_codon:yes stop_codon:yes gene_type:complete